MLIDANIFQPLIDVFAAVLKFFHNDVGVSWGVSILLLTVVVRTALIPLGIKQFHSMQRMAMHMPEMKAIRERYKDNPQRMQQETMKFYKDNNVNPFASCVPLLIQWPFLIGLFWTLRGNLRLDICDKIQKAYQAHYATIHHISRAAAAGQTTDCNGKDGSSFLFIHDLTNSPHGVEIAILLILYIGTSIGSSMIMMMPGTEPNQRRLMLVLPVVFALVTIRFPAGALLYYITFNLWMVVQQSVFKRLIGQQYRHPPNAAIGIPGDGSVSTGGGLGGLFGLSRRHVSDDGGGLPPADDPPPARAGGAKRGSPGKASGAATATVPRTAKVRAPAGKVSNGSGDSNGNGNGNGASGRQSSPPPPPRKKKKRSGRRR